MILGLYGGGFKPLTTGHMSKLLNAIDDSDKVYFFYGMQTREAPRYGKKGQRLATRQKFRSMQDPKKELLPDQNLKHYTPEKGRQVFDIYKIALEREFKNVEVQDTIGSSPIKKIMDTVDAFKSGDLVVDGKTVEKIIIYGDGPTYRMYLSNRSRFEDLLRQGKIQLGGADPAGTRDYFNDEDLQELIDKGEKIARLSLEKRYPDATESQIQRMQSIRGTEVRDLMVSPEAVEIAKAFLPTPPLTEDEKSKVIEILLGPDVNEKNTIEENKSKDYLRYFIKGIIRG